MFNLFCKNNISFFRAIIFFCINLIVNSLNKINNVFEIDNKVLLQLNFEFIQIF